jgi:glycosyltransferase involved in cell wall biosynthesis
MYSVVVPARPQEAYLLDALGSIAAQTVPAERVIVVLNGSGADTSELIGEIAAAYPQMHVRTIAKPGMISALAVGYSEVTTPFVAVLDSDDMWAPQKQELQLAALDADRQLHAVMCEAVNFSDMADGTRVEGISAITRLFSATTFRTDTFRRFGLPDSSVSHFAWLVRWWSAAHEKGIRTAAIEYRGLLRRVHDTNSWVTDRERGRADLLTELRRVHSARAACPAGEREAG